MLLIKTNITGIAADITDLVSNNLAIFIIRDPGNIGRFYFSLEIDFFRHLNGVTEIAWL
ncbi:hypothetical protein SRABI106_01115 [Rahnella aquatilis]|nr:hypothetical protein SRABI106_01115 [Rahnella aquatilis]